METISTPPQSVQAPDLNATPTRRILRRFFHNPVAIASLVVIILLFLLAIVSGGCALGGVYFPQDPNATNLAAKLQPPSAQNPLGTDNLGRDVLSRMVAGSYISLTVGFIAMAVSRFIGVAGGAISG